ncbi:hypothetical protein D3C87_1814390 [compost metagenome]
MRRVAPGQPPEPNELTAATSRLGAALAALTTSPRTAVDAPPIATATGQVERLASDAAPTMNDWIGQVRDLVERARNLEEVRDGLLALAPHMRIEDYAAALAEALTAAALAGRWE